MKSQVRDTLLPVAGRMIRNRWESVDDTVLVLQPDHLGDILLSQPAVHLLRQAFPSSRLIAIVGPWSRETVSLSWPVDDIFTLPFPGFTRTDTESPLAPYRRLKVESTRLKSFRARSAYVLRPDAWWASWLASLVAPEVVAADDPRTAAFATYVAPVRDDEHATVRAIRIASATDPIPVPTPSEMPLALPISSVASRQAVHLRQERNITDRYIVVHPGAGAAVKEWPIHRWRSVAIELMRDGFQIAMTGSDVEVEQCAAIAASVPGCISLAGQTSVSVLAELLRNAELVLGPDCGPLHLAVAVGTPTVHLFGPSDPLRYGPWGDRERHRVVSAGWHCPRCGDLSAERQTGCGCMLAIKPADVVAAARFVLSAHAS